MSNNPPIYRERATAPRKGKLPPPRRAAAVTVPVRASRVNRTPPEWRYVTIEESGNWFALRHAGSLLPITSTTLKLIGVVATFSLEALTLAEALFSGALLETVLKTYRER